VNGKVIFYADRITGSMKRAIDETERRREIQGRFNVENGITPTTIIKPVDSTLLQMAQLDYYELPEVSEEMARYESTADLEQEIGKLRQKMKEAAEKFEFEKAAAYRDQVKRLQEIELDFGGGPYAN
jgi:excinuclease ABC subunit B